MIFHKSKKYSKLAEDHLKNSWNKDKAQTYAILALVHKLDEIHTTMKMGADK